MFDSGGCYISHCSAAIFCAVGSRQKKRAIMENDDSLKTLNDANTCMALGAGVGALGLVTAAAAGATCPLCVVVAPGLIGYGAYKRWQASKDKSSTNCGTKK